MKMTHYLTVAAGLTLLCASCAKQDPENSSPVKQPDQKTITKKAPGKAQPKASTQAKTQTQNQNQRKEAAEVKETVKAKQVKPSAPSSSSNPFRAPVDDLKLPTDAEMAEGKEAATSKQPAIKPNSAPSISVKPPVPAPKPGTPQE